ncbi:MAG: hypothetical protein JST60_07155 [Chloroflexi bacterium SZAS-1]|nr:hypothetical protein [Chloroflexi bacterium SZAS-1]
MSVLNGIAHFQNRRDEVPNQELAKDLTATDDKKGIREIAENIWSNNPNIQSDCLKVLYEIGYLNPALIAAYTEDFLKLLNSKNNRIVWGSMIALSTVSDLQSDTIYNHHEEIQRILEQGSVITIDNGIKTLAIVASKNEAYRKKLLPYLLNHLATCRPKDVPQHAEKTIVAVNANHKDEFIKVLEKRMTDLTTSQAARVKRVIKEAEKR